ncbi:serine/threonine-protein kinase [Methylosarcina fibrata]|uniref:serine/threonine-protein kinase n=1 Tax=Methylosarcina fibrata TaxID=105972 RepID=UPI000399C80E|nr:serine/threonine-protein kinase [Methylosarcina fibrata]
MTGKNDNDHAEDATRIRPAETEADLSDSFSADGKQDTETIANIRPLSQQPIVPNSDATVVIPPETAASSREFPDAFVQSLETIADQSARLASAAETSGDHSSLPSPIPAVGSLIKDRYRLKEVIGRGGMGTVFRATDLLREEAGDKAPDVAIKVLNKEFRDDPELFVALQRETVKTQQLAHPNIVTVYNFDRDGKTIFMVMEILEGQSLGQYIRNQAPQGLPFRKAWPIIKGLSLALAYAHKRNIVHSDFKPGNVFITRTGEVKVLDFGIACVAAHSDAASGKTLFNARDLGALTPEYASLEMFENQPADPRDDVYALGCVAYELLTGKHPFGHIAAPKACEVDLQPRAIPGLKRRQWHALLHALAFKKEQRTASVRQFINEMEPRSLAPKIMAGVTALALLGAAGAYLYLYHYGDPWDNDIIELTPAQQLKIKDLLELAQIHYDVGFITAPSGSNALWAYRQVLAIDPYNKPAKAGLEKIADLCEQQAQELFEQNNTAESLLKIEEGLEAIPKHEGLLALKKRILELEERQ